MSNAFQVSVIIPVYNAEKYVERAVLSALEQAEVKEIVIVDDGYDDGAYAICQQLAKQHNRIKLLTHPNHENKGAAISRNLGILNASCDFIAFLDADDYFLPNRFRYTRATFDSITNIDGVYEPVGFEVITDEAMDKLKKIKRAFRENPDKRQGLLSYAKTPYSGIQLFEAYLIGGNDGAHTDGVTIKKSLVSKAGLFNPVLRLHQDTEYWMRISYFGHLAPTSNHTEPVAIRQMHDENRTYAQNNVSNLKLWRAILSWASQEDAQKVRFAQILQRYQMLATPSQTIK